MATRYLAYGTYAIPAGIAPVSEPGIRLVAADKLPRTDGARVSPPYMDARRVLFRGGLIHGPMDTSDLRTRIDALRSALAAQPQSLYFWSDRYYRNVYVGSYSEDFEATGYGRIANVEIEFILGDPFQYSTSTTSDTWTITTSGETHSIVPGGNAPALPSLALTVGGAGSLTIDWELENTTTGQSFTLAGSVTGGQVIAVDCLAQTVMIGTTDRMSLYDGEFPRLAQGANLWEVAYTGTGPSQMVTTYRARWW